VIAIDGYEFPPFDLERLLRTVFRIDARESFGVFTDLPDPRAVEGFAYLGHAGLGPQKLAFTVLYSGLLASVSATRVLRLREWRSNLDLPDEVMTPRARGHPAGARAHDLLGGALPATALMTRSRRRWGSAARPCTARTRRCSPRG
jgi:hypothetical protein